MQEVCQEAVHRASAAHARRRASVPCSWPTCGSGRLPRLGEDMTETMEVISRTGKVIEKDTSRDCRDSISPPTTNQHPWHRLSTSSRGNSAKPLVSPPPPCMISPDSNRNRQARTSRRQRGNGFFTTHAQSRALSDRSESGGIPNRLKI